MNRKTNRAIFFSATIVTMLLGLMAVIGWYTRNDFLREIFPGQVRMKFNVAACFIISSFVLLLRLYGRKNKIWNGISILLSILVSLIGLVTLIEYISGSDLGIDNFFVRDELPTTAIYYAGRMSPLSAINFLLIGCGLLLINNKRTAVWQFYYLFGIAFIALLVLIGFNFIADIPTYIRLAIHVAIGFITLPVAIWFSQPELHRKISFERKLFTGFIAAIILTVVLSIFSSYFSAKRSSTSRLVEHTNRVLSEAEQTLSLARDIESEGRGYIITGDSTYPGYFTIARNDIFNHIKNLKELTADNPSQQVRIDTLSMLINKRIDFSLQSIRLRNDRGFEAARSLMDTRMGKLYTDEIRAITSAIQREENKLLVRQQKENSKSIVSFNRSFFVFLGCFLILLVIILFSIRNYFSFRRNAEKQSKENAEQIQTIFRAAPDAVIIIDHTGKIMKWNSMSETIFGWTADEVYGKPLAEIIIPLRYREAHKKGLKHFLETGEGPVLGKTIEIQAVGKNNIEFDVALSISPTIVNEKYLFIGFIRDITERKKAADELLKFSQELEQKVIERTEELAKSEKLFRAMIEKDADMKTLSTPEGKIFYASPSLTTILGYKNHELMTMPISGLIHPGDVPGFTEGIADIVQTPGKSAYMQQRWKHKNGMWIWCEGTITNMLHEPAVAALVSNFRDITKRKQTETALQESQQLLSAIVNNSAAVIYVKDLEGPYRLVNRRFLELFHLREEDVLGKTDYDLFSKKDADAFRQMDVRTAAADHALIEEEKAPQDDGLHTYISVKSTLRDAAGKPYAIFGISTDITDRKKAQLEVEKLNEELEQKVIDRTAELQSSNKELESFTYSVSHDLRAPLRIIDGYADILVTDYENKLDDEGNRLLGIIQSNARRMGQLIDDLLNLSKTGRRELVMHFTDMNKLVSTVIDEQLYPTGNIASIKMEDLHPAECDSGLLRQVWVNLISNAIKYSGKQKEPEIKISSVRKENEVVYSVKDNGVGFDMRYAGKLFGVFQRLHGITEFEGTGIGLALANTIIIKHKGKIWAESEPGKGAAFYFSLPA